MHCPHNSNARLVHSALAAPLTKNSCDGGGGYAGPASSGDPCGSTMGLSHGMTVVIATVLWGDVPDVAVVIAFPDTKTLEEGLHTESFGIKSVFATKTGHG